MMDASRAAGSLLERHALRTEPTKRPARACLAILTLVAPLALACGGGGGSDGGTDPGPSETITLSLSASSLLLPLGQTRNVTVNITRTGKTNGSVTFSILGQAPAGVTTTFNPATVTGATASTTASITATTDVQIGHVGLLIGATSTSGASGAAPLDLSVFGPQVSVTRAGNGSGTVTSSPAGINCGGACAASFTVTPVTLTAAAAAGSTFTGWSGACTAITTTCTFTPTTATSNAVTATFTAPGFSLGLAPNAASVPQGTSAAATVTVARIGGFTGAVNLALGGVPAGLTITPGPVSVTGDSQTLTIAAALTLAAGNYPIGINATAPGVPPQGATLNVQVTPAPGGSSNIAVSFGSCDPSQVPIWFAVQDGTGAWARVTPGPNASFTFALGASGAIAYVTGGGSNFSTTVLYLSGSEALSRATGSICAINPQVGARTLTTKVLNTGPQTVTVALGGADTTFSNPAPPSGGTQFTLSNFPAGHRELIAARSTLNPNNGTNQLQKLVLRRSTTYPPNATPPQIDFGGAESFVPTVRGVWLNNLAGEKSQVSESFLTTNGMSAAFFQSPGAFAPNAGVDFVPVSLVPDSLLQPDDLHALFIGAVPSGNNPSSFRFAELLIHTSAVVPAATVTLGPALATPTVTSLGATPYPRFRTQLSSQQAYGAAADAQFSQGGNTMDIAVTAAYALGVPATWTVDIPDLSGAGYNPTWAFTVGAPVDWEVTAIGGDPLPFVGATPVDRAQIVGAGFAGSGVASASRPRSRLLRVP